MDEANDRRLNDLLAMAEFTISGIVALATVLRQLGGVDDVFLEDLARVAEGAALQRDEDPIMFSTARQLRLAKGGSGQG